MCWGSRPVRKFGIRMMKSRHTFASSWPIKGPYPPTVSRACVNADRLSCSMFPRVELRIKRCNSSRYMGRRRFPELLYFFFISRQKCIVVNKLLRRDIRISPIISSIKDLPNGIFVISSVAKWIGDHRASYPVHKKPKCRIDKYLQR